MHENGWSVVVTPNKTTSSYDPDNHYYSLECKEVYDWLSDDYDFIVGADGGLPTRIHRQRPRYPWAPGDVSDPNDPMAGYGYEPTVTGQYVGGGGGSSSSVDYLYPAKLSNELSALVHQQSHEGFTPVELEILNRGYKAMLNKTPIHAKLDKLLKSYPNLRKLNRIKLHKEQTKEGSASISRNLVLNIYGTHNLHSELLTEHLFHELIHLAQYNEHKLANIADKAYRGIMEFEGWLLRDIIKYVEGKGIKRGYSREPFGLKKKYEENEERMHTDMDIDSAYGAWLSDMTDKGKKYPTAPIDRTKFREFALQFLKESFNYPILKYPLDKNLVYEPSLLDSIFKAN